MLTFFINRAGRQLSPARRAELERAKRLMQRFISAPPPPTTARQGSRRPTGH